MAGFTLRKHMVFDWEGTEYTILDVNSNGQILLENVKDKLLTLESKVNLLSAYKAGDISAKTPSKALACAAVPVYSRPLDELTEKDRQEIQRRKHYLDWILAEGNPVFTAHYLNPLIATAAQAIGDASPPSYISVFRWYCRYMSCFDPLALKSGKNRRGSRKLRLCETVMKITVEGIAEAYKNSSQSTVDTIYTLVSGKVTEENQKRLPKDQLKLYTKRTLFRLIKSADVYDMTVLKEGKPAADKRLKVVLQGVKTKRILERVEVDHTPLDLFLVDEKTWLPLGRPTLTVLIDHYSRMVLGYYLTYGSPSTAAVMGALRHAILPKTPVEEIIPNRKINHLWPCYGVPEVMVCDNGLEFHGRDLESVAYDLGLRLLFCPKKQPRFKGVVERFLKTINYSFASQIPGASFAKYYLRGGDDPLKGALLTMAEFKHVFEKWLLDIYSQDLHSGIGCTPWSRWQESAAQKEPELPIDLRTLQRRIGLVEERKLQKNGILLNGIRYSGHVLTPLLNTYGVGVMMRVLYDPDDLGEIQVWGPDQAEPIEVKALEYEYAKGLILKQHQFLRKQLLDKGAETFNQEALLAEKYSLIQTINELMGSRKLKSRKQGSILAGINSEQPGGSMLVREDKAKPKLAAKPKVPKKPEFTGDKEMPPLLPSFQMKRNPGEQS